MQCQNMNESRCSDECGGNVPDMREVGPVIELAQIARIEDLSWRVELETVHGELFCGIS